MIHLESDIACDFAEWVSKYDWVFMADRNYWVNDDSRLHPKTTKQLFQEYLKDIEQKQKGELPPLAKEKYKFTEEDMRKSFQCGQQWVHDITNTDKEPVNFNDFIQSLSQPKMPTAFTETDEIERRRKMFHWYIDGIGFHITQDNHLMMFHTTGIDWIQYKHLTPDWVTKNYNVAL